jgi:diguanylate cyclase (GGDEF)-like protein/PAS domain S-box-containing protein
MFKWRPFFRTLFTGRTPTPATTDSSPESDSSLRYLVENSGDVIIRSGPDLLMSYVSPSVTYLLGYQPEELIGTRPDSLIFSEDMGVIADADHALRSGNSKATVTTVRVRHRDGSTIWMESTARLVEGLTDQGPDISVIMRDVTYRKRIEDELAEQALKDGLTGLANRRAFDAMLNREWQHTLHEGHPTSLLLLDVDHFKMFNDQLGHQVGDDCLRAVSAAVEAAVDKVALVARYGGEEIAIILPNTDSARTQTIAETVRLAVVDLKIPHPANKSGENYLTVSIGAATALPRTGGTIKMPEGLLQAADTALYRAKNNGRNRVEISLLLTPDEYDGAAAA